MEGAQVGLVRDSMLVNPLLIRPSLGRTRSKGLAIPGPDFVYGTVTTVKDGGVSEALSHWRSHSLPGSSSGAHGRRGEKDFVVLNREGVKSGLVTAKEHYQYRATHDVRCPTPAKKGSRLDPAHRIPDMTFGIPTRPSTPISHLLEQRYAKRWLEEQQSRDQATLERRHTRVQLGRVPETRTTLLRKSVAIAEPPSLWKLPRFQQVGPALNTFRDPAARRKALRAQHSDTAAPRDLLLHGSSSLS
ncbi:cilia- and flagella-associated protein 77 [Megalops cyprinoides]|uniref:cilia- and flagella-associated protein 77 n=1 Tax=Megalops cyprinoides TaxID=118141 RepID=UPI0018641382|nr:cilia- and flagella-associated protein 77 [Megalops cyprinoides]